MVPCSTLDHNYKPHLHTWLSLLWSKNLSKGTVNENPSSSLIDPPSSSTARPLKHETHWQCLSERDILWVIPNKKSKISAPTWNLGASDSGKLRACIVSYIGRRAQPNGAALGKQGVLGVIVQTWVLRLLCPRNHYSSFFSCSNSSGLSLEVPGQERLD